MGAKDHRGVANLDPRVMVGRIYVGDHWTLIHTKCIICMPHGFREDFFNVLSNNSMEILDHQGGTRLDPRGWLGRVYVKNH